MISKLFGLKSATDYASVMPELEGDLATARERLSRLKAQMRTAPFESGAGEVKRLRQEIRETEDEIETLVGLVDETENRRKAAAQADEDQSILEELAEARRAVLTLGADFASFDEHLTALREIIERAGPVIGQAQRANARAGMVTTSYPTGHPPRFHDARAWVPTVHVGELKAAVDQLSRHGVTKWFKDMRAGGKLK